MGAKAGAATTRQKDNKTRHRFFSLGAFNRLCAHVVSHCPRPACLRHLGEGRDQRAALDERGERGRLPAAPGRLPLAARLEDGGEAVGGGALDGRLVGVFER